MARWTIRSDFGLVNRRAIERERPEYSWETRDQYWDVTWRHTHERDGADSVIIADLPYVEALAMAAHVKWELETVNGYKFVYTVRQHDARGKLVRISYMMLQWGGPTREIITITREAS